jgi:hypothetical protein
MHQIKQIEVDHRKAFMRMCECYYDLINGEENPIARASRYDAMARALRKFMTKTGIHLLCHEGEGVYFLDMDVIDELDQAEIPYVVIVRKDGDVFATISCDEIEY